MATVYVMTAGSGETYRIERVYLDRDEAYKFAQNYNGIAPVEPAQVEEWQIGAPHGTTPSVITRVRNRPGVGQRPRRRIRRLKISPNVVWAADVEVVADDLLEEDGRTPAHPASGSARTPPAGSTARSGSRRPRRRR